MSAGVGKGSGGRALLGCYHDLLAHAGCARERGRCGGSWAEEGGGPGERVEGAFF